MTGEHTCMVLKPLNNDEIEVSGSDEWGFFSPFYQGQSYFNLTVSCLFSYTRFAHVIPLLLSDFKSRFARLLEAESSFSKMEYKLAMRLELKTLPPSKRLFIIVNMLMVIMIFQCIGPENQLQGVRVASNTIHFR